MRPRPGWQPGSRWGRGPGEGRGKPGLLVIEQRRQARNGSRLLWRLITHSSCQHRTYTPRIETAACRSTWRGQATEGPKGVASRSNRYLAELAHLHVEGSNGGRTFERPRLQFGLSLHKNTSCARRARLMQIGPSKPLRPRLAQPCRSNELDRSDGRPPGRSQFWKRSGQWPNHGNRQTASNLVPAGPARARPEVLAPVAVQRGPAAAPAWAVAPV